MVGLQRRRKTSICKGQKKEEETSSSIKNEEVSAVRLSVSVSKLALAPSSDSSSSPLTATRRRSRRRRHSTSTLHEKEWLSSASLALIEEKDNEEEDGQGLLNSLKSSSRPSSVKRMRLENNRASVLRVADVEIEEARGDLDQEMEESIENQEDASFTMTPATAPRATAVRRFRGSSKQLGIPAKKEEEEQRVVLKMDEEEEERTEEEIEEEEEEEERHDQTFATDGTREDAGDGDADDEEEEEKQKQRGERDTEDDDSRSSAANSGQEDTTRGCQKMENDEEEEEQEEMERESDGESAPQEFLETDDIDEEEEEEEEDVEKCEGEDSSEFAVHIDEDFEGEENQPTPSTFDDLRKLRIEGGSYDPIKRMESFRGMAQRLENCVELGSQEPSQLTNRCEGLGKAHEVWNLLCRKDSMYSIMDVHFMDGLGPKFAERTILVDWMMEVCAGENLHRETFHLAVDYIDRFISNMRKLSLPVSVGEFQLIGTTAIHIAAKYEEIYPPKLDEIVTYTDGACTEEQVRRLELVLLKVLEWELNVVTSLHWLHIFLQLLGGTTDGNSDLLVSEDGDQSGHFTEGTMPVTVPACLRSEFVHMAQVLDICLMFGECRAFSNRQLAAAILFLCVEPASLVEHITGITLHEAGAAMEFAREIEEWCTERRPAGDPLPYIEGVRPDDVHNIQRYHSAEIDELKKSLAQRRHARAVKREQRRQAVGTTKQATAAAPVSGRPKSRPPIREIRLQATTD